MSTQRRRGREVTEDADGRDIADGGEVVSSPKTGMARLAVVLLAEVRPKTLGLRVVVHGLRVLGAGAGPR
jgi:hypothetical protein